MQALAGDDPEALMVAFSKACAALQIGSSELLMQLEHGLWRPSRGTGPGGKNRSLVAVAAGNKQGVPPCGSVKCLKELLCRFPSAHNTEELLWAENRAQELGRMEAVVLLRRFLSGVDISQDADLCSDTNCPAIPEVC